MRLTKERVVNALQKMGVTPQQLQAFKCPRAEAPVRLSELRVILKPHYRALVRKHHPDAGGLEAEFHKVQDAWDVLESDDMAYLLWEGVNAPPRPQPRVVVVQIRTGFQTSTTSVTNYTTAYGGFTPGNPDFLKGF